MVLIPKVYAEFFYVIGILCVLRQARRAVFGIPDEAGITDERLAQVVPKAAVRSPVKSSSSRKVTTATSSTSTKITTKNHKKTKRPTFPEACSIETLQILEYQLPEFRCRKLEKRPWSHHCSFSYATRCPDSAWFYKQPLQHTTLSGEQATVPITAVFINTCSDYTAEAAATLHHMTGDDRFSVATWQQKTGEVDDDWQCPVRIQAVTSKTKKHQLAEMHCIETDPHKSLMLTKTIKTLGWQDSVVVHTHQDAMHQFRTIEYLRLGGEVLVLDTVSQHRRYLQSAVKYLEFEYNFRDAWKQVRLEHVIQLLKEVHFVCYFAGTHSHLWRITDCWQEHYNTQFWSNVACVNIETHPVLAATMELEYYTTKTLQQGYSIHYLNDRMIGTDGRKENAKPPPTRGIDRI
jgi:hypothetical protein